MRETSTPSSPPISTPSSPVSTPPLVAVPPPAPPISPKSKPTQETADPHLYKTYKPNADLIDMQLPTMPNIEPQDHEEGVGGSSSPTTGRATMSDIVHADNHNSSDKNRNSATKANPSEPSKQRIDLTKLSNASTDDFNPKATEDNSPPKRHNELDSSPRKHRGSKSTPRASTSPGQSRKGTKGHTSPTRDRNKKEKDKAPVSRSPPLDRETV